jgi:hypothetical protein
MQFWRSGRKPQPLRFKPAIGDLVREDKLLEVGCGSGRCGTSISIQAASGLQGESGARWRLRLQKCGATA